MKDKETRETFTDEECETLLRGFLSPRLFEKGLICRADDRGDPVVQISPPLVATQAGVRRDDRDPRRRSRRGVGAARLTVEAATPLRRHCDEYDIRLIGLTKRFDDVVAVDDISLDIDRGQFFALLGPSGCGKTTTLRMIGGFEEPTAGRDRARRRRRRGAAAVQARRQHRVPVVRALPAPLDLRERRLRAAPPRRHARAELRTRGRRGARARRPRGARAAASRGSSPAASSSGRARPRARQPAARAAPRRAARRTRPEAAQGRCSSS